MLRLLVPSLMGVLAVALVVSWLHGCNTAEVTPAPDAGDDACTPVTVTFCDPLEAGALGCVANPSSPSETIRKLPANKAYPVGCKANLVNPDEQGECKLVSTCTCNPPGASGDAGDAGSAPQWQCDK